MTETNWKKYTMTKLTTYAMIVLVSFDILNADFAIVATHTRNS